ncbi:hypothetical protein ACFV2H_06895 [Streptomyces sp. NPDC059629]|uniref:hypothetical protein n=1 Tax=Streptomyces sp. NPDC059629 TaxID=3346889 RepID=UPI003697D812
MPDAGPPAPSEEDFEGCVHGVFQRGSVGERVDVEGVGPLEGSHRAGIEKL